MFDVVADAADFFDWAADWVFATPVFVCHAVGHLDHADAVSQRYDHIGCSENFSGDRACKRLEAIAAELGYCRAYCGSICP